MRTSGRTANTSAEPGHRADGLPAVSEDSGTATEGGGVLPDDGAAGAIPEAGHARDSDFEHAVPYDQGGRTCACNAGARCRHHHHAKQAPGWRLDQHQPGHHTWTTPSGRTYTTGPTTYPT